MRAIELQGLTLVLVGDFNPKIFQPDWFALQDLMTSEEASNADVEIVHPDVCSFSVDWASLQVTREKFIIRSQMDPYFERVRDITLASFSILQHTPLKMLGINHDAHYSTVSETEWNEIGHHLAPKDDWKGVLDAPGLRTLIIEESKRRDGRKGHLQIKVEPSQKVTPGIFLHLNDHYVFETKLEPAASAELKEILDEGWSRSLDRWNQIRTEFEKLAEGLSK